MYKLLMFLMLQMISKSCKNYLTVYLAPQTIAYPKVLNDNS